LVALEREEQQEAARILAELTEAVRARRDALAGLVDTLGALDWVFARAHVAERMEASRPAIDRDGRVDLKAARHPLLLAQQWRDATREVVPVDLELAPDRPLLLITGPNAGGKTIALKTLALLSLMTQARCHVPAAEPRARNASVEFDAATLAPTFRLVYDRPGQSWALAIAARLGLPRTLILRAEGLRTADARRLSELLAQLDARNRSQADRVRELERRETETAARLAAAREAERLASDQARTLLARAKAEAGALLPDLRPARS